MRWRRKRRKKRSFEWIGDAIADFFDALFD